MPTNCTVWSIILPLQGEKCLLQLNHVQEVALQKLRIICINHDYQPPHAWKQFHKNYYKITTNNTVKLCDKTKYNFHCQINSHSKQSLKTIKPVDYTFQRICKIYNDLTAVQCRFLTLFTKYTETLPLSPLMSLWLKELYIQHCSHHKRTVHQPSRIMIQYTLTIPFVTALG